MLSKHFFCGCPFLSNFLLGKQKKVYKINYNKYIKAKVQKKKPGWPISKSSLWERVPTAILCYQEFLLTFIPIFNSPVWFVTLPDSIVTTPNLFVTNRDSIVTNRDSIVTNREAIDANRDSIDANRDSIDANREAIVTSRDSIVTSRDSIDANRDSIDANRDSIDALPAYF